MDCSPNVAIAASQCLRRHGTRRCLGRNNVLAAILVPQFQGTGSSLGPQSHVSVLRARRASETETRSWLGGCDLDGWSPTLSDETQQYGLSFLFAVVRLGGREHLDARSNAT